ncbi:MAG: M15 family metallopeptidase [Clostridia bacterium]|nr:M15 family metallopeptidase [Clostridia bacterium]
MNKKITPRVIRIIALQSVIVMIAVTVLGGAVITHQRYKTVLANPNMPVEDSYEILTQPIHSTTESTSAQDSPEDTTAGQTTGTTAPTSQPESKPAPENETPNNQYPYAYAGFTPQITDVNADLSKFIVNSNYTLPANYKPTLAEAVKGSGVYLDYRVAPYYQQMYDAALADGITLTPVSGYRSYERQQRNFENRIKENMDAGMDKTEATKSAATVIMVPGSSEHNAGLAMDICSLAQSFENYDEFEWLDQHAAEYGFILRYPKDEKSRNITGVIYEPWHYRFVGIETAKEIKERGITLEEYLGLA